MGSVFSISLRMVIVMTVLCGLIYPLAITGLAQVIFPHQANGSLVTDGSGKVIGSSLIAQPFTSDKYFWPRPSAAGDDGYDASSSSASNKGPTSKDLIDFVDKYAADYRKANGLAADAPVPGTAVTRSGSGLDPHITPEDAELQTARVAKARNMSVGDVKKVVAQHTEGKTLGFIGDARVNVLELNMALDGIQK